MILARGCSPLTLGTVGTTTLQEDDDVTALGAGVEDKITDDNGRIVEEVDVSITEDNADVDKGTVLAATWLMVIFGDLDMAEEDTLGTLFLMLVFFSGSVSNCNTKIKHS